MYYRLATDEGKRKKYAYAIGLGGWPREDVSCSKCNREWKKSTIDEFGVSTPVVLSNDNYPDYMWYYITHISEKAKSVMELEGITGFKVEDALIISFDELTEAQKKELRWDGVKVNKIPSNPPHYYKLHVCIGAEYHENSNLVLLESCDDCGYEKYVSKGKEWVDSSEGIFLKKGSLIGYDLFKVKGYGATIFCSEKFVEAYKRHALTGLDFDEIEVI